MSFISAVPDHQKPALFQSLLFEACGRTVNPVNGAVGLLSTGNWHVCQAAVETVLSGGILRPIPGILAGNLTPDSDESSEAFCTEAWKTRDAYSPSNRRMRFEKDGEAADLSLSVTPRFSTKVTARRGKRSTTSFNTDQSSVGTSFEYGGGNREDRKVLDLFV
ncbi:hypothetical protein L1049_025884 [Liquidambar formosana]|uniref:LOB domain-containing protein n=1 Tax=Liquidambar formosana TaxID=63359 RepID=A0AAP0NDX2_LIQFO